MTTLQKACTNAQFEANPAGCPPESDIGHATVHTPLLPVPLTGPAIFVSHGGEAFPSLTMVLQGDGVTIDLVGTTFISKTGVTSTTFKTVPDQPFSTFELTLPTGKFSALTALGNLCTEKLTMPTEFVAQNGAEIHEVTKIGVTGCKKAKTLTRAQKLKAALKACHKDRNKCNRARCEKTSTQEIRTGEETEQKEEGEGLMHNPNLIVKFRSADQLAHDRGVLPSYPEEILRMRKSLPSRVRGFVLTLLAALALAALVAVPAQAAYTQIGAFGPEGPGSGPFAEPVSIAVEQKSGDVYVYERGEDLSGEKGNVYKFNAAGEEEEFSSLHTNVIEGVGGRKGGTSQIAVDSSSGPDAGDIYVANGAKVLIYNSAGEALAPLTEVEEPEGVAVDPSGAVYVAFSDTFFNPPSEAVERIQKYTPIANPVTTANYTCTLPVPSRSARNIAADSENIYTTEEGDVTKYKASQCNTEEIEQSGEPVRTVWAPRWPSNPPVVTCISTRGLT